MRLTVLGGAAAGVNPGQGCSGYLVQAGGTALVLDLGPGTLHELRRHADIRHLDAVVVSHLHLDHVLDILALRYSLAYSPARPAGRVPLWLPPGGLPFFDRLATALTAAAEGVEAFFGQVFDLAEYDPGEPLAVGRLTLSFCPTVHYVPCWAARIKDGDGTGDLVYGADTGPAAPLAAFAHAAALLVAEGGIVDPGDEPIAARGHLTPAEAGTIALEAGAERLLLAHVWDVHNPDHAAELAARAFAGPVLLARPGLVVEW